jgi:hypothetical protein
VSSKRLGSEAPPSWSAKGRFTSTRFAFFATAEKMTLNDLANWYHLIENDLMIRPAYPDAKPLGAFSIGPRRE